MQSALQDVLRRFYPASSSSSTCPRHRVNAAIADPPVENLLSTTSTSLDQTVDTNAPDDYASDHLPQDDQDDYDSDAYHHDV
jgi:hypothetical protein